MKCNPDIRAAGARARIPPAIEELEKLFPSLVAFPPPSRARRDGLLAVGGDLLPGTLIRAYARGIFPWSVDPITWWSPDPRAIFEIDTFELPKRMQRYARSGIFEITFDRSFREVIEACAEPAPGREDTWISQEFVTAYTRLHGLGLAHSVEARMEGRLVGGAYGVALGGFFAGESMFHRASNASTIALGALMHRLRERGFVLFDTQVLTHHTLLLGAREIPRQDYLTRLHGALGRSCEFS
ncbi:MAG TPA: leucyl/phenylalanyl-tRNA--protein transferase [Candidatus Ozemobacteraceae bacterium]|nr:leucyl/phenylalanyl-tRNA--protein transferase [Candidatus Ozemobacteraceae bacterium]